MTILNTTIKASMLEKGFAFIKFERTNEPLRFKVKVLNAADAMLKLLDGYTSNDDLNYPSKGNSGKYWWSGRAIDGKRYVRVYQANRLVDADMDAIEAEDTIAGVRRVICELRAQIASTNDDDWLEIEQQRAEQQQKAAEKAKERRAKKQ